MQEDLIDLQHDETTREADCEKTLYNFWFCMLKSSERVAEPALRTLLFPTTRLSESVFSLLLGITNETQIETEEPRT